MQDRYRTAQQVAAAWLDGLRPLRVEWVADDRLLREGQRTMRTCYPEVWAEFKRCCEAAQVAVPGPDWEAGA